MLCRFGHIEDGQVKVDNSLLQGGIVNKIPTHDGVPY